MRKWGGILILACIVLLSACDDKEGNSKLDGMWQMKGTNIYYSFQVNIVNIKQTGGSSYFGRYTYENDTISMAIRGATVEGVKALGLNDTIQSFEVEKLTHKSMILRTEDNRYSFRKY